MAGSVWVRRRKNEDAIDCPFRRPPPGAQLKYSHRCLSSVLFKRRRPSPWNTCTTGAPSSSGRRRLRPDHQDRALSSTFLSDKSIRFKQLYIQIFELRPLEFLKKLSPSPSYRFPCSQLAAPSALYSLYRGTPISYEFPLFTHSCSYFIHPHMSLG